MIVLYLDVLLAVTTVGTLAAAVLAVFGVVMVLGRVIARCFSWR